MLEAENVPDVTASHHGVVVDGFTGWLEKQADWKLLWNKRLVTIKGRTVSYRERETLPDKNCARLQALQKYAGQERTFRIWTERGECWLLRAPDDASYLQWTQLMENALLDEHEDEGHLQGVVEKRMQWTGQWKSRFVVIEGVEMRYSEREGMGDKRRYVLVAADLCVDPSEIRFLASNGDSFHIRFKNEDEAKRWHSVLWRSLERATAFRWQALSIEGERRSRGFLGSVFHCATMIDDHHLLVFGGISSTLPASMFRATCSNEVVCLSFWGDHPCEVMTVQPFEDGPGARIRPASRESAASCVLGGTWFIHGGINESRTSFNDMWCIRMSASGTKLMAWERLFSITSCPLPSRYGHALTAVPGHNTLLLTGGFSRGSHGDVAVAEIVLVDVTAAERAPSGSESVKVLPLDRPRGYHAACKTADGESVLLIGGCREYGSSMNTLLATAVQEVTEVRLSDLRCSTVQVDPPLPPLIAPAAVTRDDGEIFVFGGNGTGLPQLYSLWSTATCAYSARRVEVLGETPRMHYGMSMCSVGSYLYVVGDSAVPPAGPVAARALVPSSKTQGSLNHALDATTMLRPEAHAFGSPDRLNEFENAVGHDA